MKLFNIIILKILEKENNCLPLQDNLLGNLSPIQELNIFISF